jgi:hypothetical protein
MSWSGSAVFEAAQLQMAKKLLNLNTDVYFGAMFNNTTAPDNTVALANTIYGVGQWVTANEVPNSGTYAAGGQSLSGDTSVSVISGTGMVFASSVQPQWTGVTWTGGNAPAGILHYDSSVSNQGLAFNWFGAPAPISGGIFTVTYSSSPAAGSIAEWAL